MTKHKGQVLWLILVWGLVIFIYLYLGQMDLMRHLFITECHTVNDIWTVGFGFPLLNPWKPVWNMSIQVAFDYSFAIIGIFTFILAIVSTYHILRKKRD